jgi:hypothetical protein
MAGHSCRPVIAGLVVVLLGLTASTARAQSCTDALVMTQVRPWELVPNAGHVTLAGAPRISERAIFRSTDAYREMFVAAYPEGRGGIIKGDGVILEPSVYTLSKVIPYRYTASFFPYHCNKTRGDLVTDPNYLTVNSAEIAANDLRYVLEELDGEYDLNGHPVKLFKLAATKGTLHGLTVYKPFAYDGSSAVVLSHHGRLPYRALTQREYLQAVKARWEKELAETAGMADVQEREIRAQMEEVKKELTGDTLATVLKGLNAQLVAVASQREARARAQAKMRDQEVAPIDRYLTTTPESELRRVAIPKAPGDHRGFTTEQDGGNQIVVLDESYVNKSLPPHAAQVLVMYWYNDPVYAGSRLFRERVEQGFPFEKLKAMVDR